MFSSVSTRLKAEMDTVTSSTNTGVFLPTCVIHNPNTGFKFTPRYIVGLDIIQDFHESYLDATQVVIRINPSEYKEIIENSLDLECTIALTPVDPTTGRAVFRQKPIYIKGSVIIRDQQDPSKVINANAIPDNDDTETNSPGRNEYTSDFTFHIIDKGSYALRHTQLNTILTGVTIEQVLHWVAQQLSIETIKIVPPDNTQTYGNFIIPVMDASKVFNFIQNRYGIYSKGLGYYYSENTLYVYPQYDTDNNNSTENGIVRLISAPENWLLGNDHYHTYVDDDLWVVSNSRKDMISLNSVGEENTGNVHVSANTDNQRDQSVVINTDGTVTRSASSLSVIQASNKKGSVSSTSSNFKYVGQRSNIYQSTAEMSANNGSMLSCGWGMALPKAIKPGQVVTYQYDDANMRFTAQNGRILRVQYTSTTQPMQKSGTFMLTFSAALGVFLDPDKITDDIVAYA